MLARENECLNWVRKAQLGDQDSLDRLAEAARVRLHEYVFRLTLAEDLTQDIVQETILEMLRLLGKLRKADRFWEWLYGIAFNKVRNHYGRQWRHKTRPLSENGPEPAGKAGDEVLAQVVTEELKQIVLDSIQRLEPRQRAVLTMRCYDHMSYAEIARLMGCSEIGTRALFYRAKKTLARLLSDHGLTKGSLVMALIVFGKMTAVSEATAAEISVSAATVSVGPVAALLATATSKVGIVTLATAGVLAAGTIAATHEWATSQRDVLPDHSRDWLIPSPQAESSAPLECWYYFPEGPDQSVMTRLMSFDNTGGKPVCLVLENQHANYYFEHRANTVTIASHHMWQEDLRVRRLPTDPPELSDFLARVEGGPRDVPLTAGRGKGLLIVYERSAEGRGRIRQVERHPNGLEEEYFQFGWPESAHVVDQRDAMHQRGWTYFRLSGYVNGMAVSGTGRLPFTFAARQSHYPWLELRIGSRVRAVDAKNGAIVYDRDGRIAARYASGGLFQGLARPWMGLHAIDTIRRDAARQQLRFQTEYDGGNNAKVVVQTNAVTLVYTINMEQDTIERIALTSAQAEGSSAVSGEIEFTYLQDTDGASAPFPEPRVSTGGSRESNERGMLWLVRLLQSENE